MKAALCLALAACLAVSSYAQTDADVLNFALNLEYLEGEFYSCAAFGKPLADNLRGGGPASTGCQKAQLSTIGQAYAEEIAQNEIDHVTFLRSALGSSAVPIPAINIGSAFGAAANAAAGMTLSPTFSPYLSDLFFYHGAYIFEPVGVTAYIGAAPLIMNDTYLSAAAGILAVEAYHSGIVDTLLYQNANMELPYNVTVAEFIELIADLENKVDSNSISQGIETSSGSANLVPTGTAMNSIIQGRTPAQVLDIVYLGSSTKPGGFFPNGINGYFGPSGAGTSSAGK